MIERRGFLLGVSGVVGTTMVGMTMDSSPNSEIIGVTTPDAVGTDDSFNISVETRDTTATVIKVTGDAESINLSNEDAIEKSENQIRFVDISSSDSTYNVSVDITNGEPDGEIVINTWVNNEMKDKADDVVEKTVSIKENGEEDSEVPGDVEKALVTETATGDVKISKTVRLHNGCAEVDKGITTEDNTIAWFDSIDESEGMTMCTMQVSHVTDTVRLDSTEVETGDEITIKDKEIDGAEKYTVTGDETTSIITLN